MLEKIGQILVGEVGWGVKARVSIGAATSMIDLGTDIFVCYTFWKDKRMDYFKMTLSIIIFSMFLQLFIVGVQNSKRGAKRTMLEALPVFFGLKPAVDAFRIGCGVKEEVGRTVDVLTEIKLIKCAELFPEAIPGVIIQLLAILTADDGVSMASWLSLGASALSAGFISATILCELHVDITDSSLYFLSSSLPHPRLLCSILDDYDTDPILRQEAPNFYGYIPTSAKKRTVVFMSLLLISTLLQLIVRCLTIVLLGLSGGKAWAIGFIFADLGHFFLAKIILGDFWYW